MQYVKTLSEASAPLRYRSRPRPAKLLAGADTLCPDEVRILLTCCYRLKDNEVQDFNLIVAAGQQLVVRGLPLVPDRLGPGQLSDARVIPGMPPIQPR